MSRMPVTNDWLRRSDGPMYISAGSSSRYVSRAASARALAFSPPWATTSTKRSKLRNGPAS
ncbi:hypothetical protein [Streptomyces violaceus]|uniref:hypothetical protein n=1 Tax=Streptomyces violaceus TaxID=1936 RepID=UPI0031F0E869